MIQVKRCCDNVDGPVSIEIDHNIDKLSHTFMVSDANEEIHAVNDDDNTSFNLKQNVIFC